MESIASLNTLKWLWSVATNIGSNLVTDKIREFFTPSVEYSLHSQFYKSFLSTIRIYGEKRKYSEKSKISLEIKRRIEMYIDDSNFFLDTRIFQTRSNYRFSTSLTI